MLKTENTRAFIEKNIQPLSKKQGVLLILMTWLLSTLSLIGAEYYLQIYFVVAMNSLLTIFLLFTIFKSLSFQYITILVSGTIFTYLAPLFVIASFGIFSRTLNHKIIILIIMILIITATVLLTLYTVYRNIKSNKYIEEKKWNSKKVSTNISVVCLLGLVIYKMLSHFLDEEGVLLILSTGMFICAIFFTCVSVLNITKIVLYVKVLKPNKNV